MLHQLGGISLVVRTPVSINAAPLWVERRFFLGRVEGWGISPYPAYDNLLANCVVSPPFEERGLKHHVKIRHSSGSETQIAQVRQGVHEACLPGAGYAKR